MKIIYLYPEVMGYTVATIKALADLGCEVHVVHWDEKKLTPYNMPDFSLFHKYPRAHQSFDSLKELINKISPKITVVPAWQDSTYLRISRWLRSHDKIVVSGLDQQWQASPKQKLASVLGKFRFFKRYFSHIWVCGVYQYEFARKIGYDKNEIIYDLYSADVSLFSNIFQRRLLIDSNDYPHRFLYVGRYEPVKGLNDLILAWQNLSTNRRNWQLHLVGSGSLRDSLYHTEGIVVKDFMQPEELAVEVQNAGCFVMPSIKEPWGVVAHEMAASGLPMVVSDAVGSSNAFLISGYNGYTYESTNLYQLEYCLNRIINHTNDDLIKMGYASHNLSKKISPLTSARNLLSVIQ